jgi:hypothetical protein
MAFADDRISFSVAEPGFISENGGRSPMIVMYKNEMEASSF